MLNRFKHIYVISVKDATERRRQFDLEAARIGLRYQFFDAVTPCDVLQQGIRFRGIENPKAYCYNRIALVQSHRRIIEMAERQCFEDVMIFEDDVRFADDFNNKIEPVLDAMREVESNTFSLGRCIDPRERIIPVAGCEMIGRAEHLYGRQCYVVKRDVYPVYLAYLELAKEGYIDATFNRHRFFEDPRIRYYSTTEQHPSESLIIHTNPFYLAFFDKKPTTWN